MPHPNNMTTWAEIGCQRNCREHATKRAYVDLFKPHGYPDLTPIPWDLAVEFEMTVWDTTITPVDGRSYCPARDVVSHTILNHGIWEPRETVMALRAFKESTGAFFDFGAQVGWFCHLARAYGRDAFAVEADPDCAALLEGQGITTIEKRITASTHFEIVAEVPYSLVKIDLEGAEREAIAVLGPWLSRGLVERMMIEISPVFDDYYPEMVIDLLESGFRAYRLPTKAHPPVEMSGDHRELLRFTGTKKAVRDEVASWHQEDLWFVREDLA